MNRFAKYLAARKLEKTLRALENLVPLIFHDHTNGRSNCPACMIGHPFAPHFKECKCGHCPDPDKAADAVRQCLRAQDVAQNKYQESKKE